MIYTVIGVVSMLISAKPDLDAYNNAMTMSTAELVTALRDLLGAKLVAYLGRVKETRAVRQWAEGTRTSPTPPTSTACGWPTARQP